MKITTNIKCKILIGTCPGTPKGTAEGQHRDTNNNDNNIFLLFNNKEIAENFVGFEEGDEISEFLKTKGIKNIEEYKKLTKKEQDNLLDEWFLKTN